TGSEQTGGGFDQARHNEKEPRMQPFLSLLPTAMFFLGTADATKDPTSIQGNWRAVEYHNDGRSPPKETVRKMTVGILGHSLRMGTPGKTEEYKFPLDPKVTPRAITLRSSKSDKQEFPGIYELKGDTLRIGLQFSGGRPKEFPTKPRSGCTFLLLQKEK